MCEMGYFSDLDIRMREAGMVPDQAERTLEPCPYCGKALAIDGMRGLFLECHCTDPKCEGFEMTLLRQTHAARSHRRYRG